MANKKIDLLGFRFGRWLVVSPSESRGQISTWLCKCECGTLRTVDANRLKSGRSNSCGCLRSELRAAGHFSKPVHGMNGTLTYRVWSNMKQRCLNPDHFQFMNYGGRGIAVCKRWLSFENFFADMGEKPDGLSLERMDNNKGYDKKNCKWAIQSEQLANRRNTRKVKINGKFVLVTEASKATGLSARLIASRLDKGWGDELALSPTKWVRVASAKHPKAAPLKQ